MDPNPAIMRGIDHLIEHDPVLSNVIARYPAPSLVAHENYFESLVKSIISQQLSVKAAATITKRFIESFDSFPMPEMILQRDELSLRTTGLSRQKITYIKDLSDKTHSGSIDFRNIEQLSNQDIVELLTQVKGIGEWTVHMFLIFCMGRLDVLPTGDLGIKNGIRGLYDLDENPNPQDIAEIARIHRWYPYESIASWYIWRSLENKPDM